MRNDSCHADAPELRIFVHARVDAGVQAQQVALLSQQSLQAPAAPSPLLNHGLFFLRQRRRPLAGAGGGHIARAVCIQMQKAHAVFTFAMF